MIAVNHHLFSMAQPTLTSKLVAKEVVVNAGCKLGNGSGAWNGGDFLNHLIGCSARIVGVSRGNTIRGNRTERF